MQSIAYGSNERTKCFIARLGKVKTADPVVKVPISQIPADAGKRHFETWPSETGDRHYEILKGIIGTVTNIYKSNRVIAGQNECFLVLEMESGGEQISFEVGNYTSQYSRNVLARLLSEYYNPAAPASFSPYDVTNKENGKESRNLGVVVFQGADKVPAMDYKTLNLLGCPDREAFYNPVEKREQYNYEPVVDWLYERVKAKWASVDPISAPAAAPTPIQTNVKASPAANTLASANVGQILEAWDAKGMKEMVTDDDLPF